MKILNKTYLILLFSFLSINVFGQIDLSKLTRIELNGKYVRISPSNVELPKENVESMSQNFKDISNSPNIHIPSSKELDNLFSQNYSSSSRVKISDCPFPNSLVCSFQVHKKRDFYGDDIHPHVCPVCEDWNESYRSQRRCDHCRNERVVFCGKTVTCPYCIKGKLYDTINGVTGLGFQSYLEKQYDINSSSISYFDSETDFGVYTFDSYNNRFVKKVLYENIKFTLLIIDGPSKVKIERDQDEKTTELIQTYITQKNYPKAIASYKQLNTPNKDLIDKINQLEDEKQLEIISLFRNKNNELAYEKYQLLYLSTNEIDKLVLDYLNVKNKTKVVSMTSERVFELLKNAPISQLKLLSEGNYRVFLDKNGECTIFSNSKEVCNYKVDVYKYCSKITESKFDFYVNSELNINLSLKSTLLKVVDVTSTKDFKVERNPTVKYIENPDIPKNKYCKMEVISSTLLFDKEKITSYETINFLSEHKLKGQHLERNAAIILVSVLAYPVYWIVQNYIEYNKVFTTEKQALENL